MKNFIMKTITEKEYKIVRDIMNSNKRFLQENIGMESVDVEFVKKEALDKEENGFVSELIMEKDGTVVGFCDYKMGTKMYLSLLMLQKEFQRIGIGSRFYQEFEEELQEKNVKFIRAEVAYSYEESATTFFEKMGFERKRPMEIIWNEHTSKVYVYEKKLKNKKNKTYLVKQKKLR